MSYAIRIEEGFGLSTGDGGAVVKTCYLAKVYDIDPLKDWPTKRQRPVIALYGELEEDALQQVMLWVQAGKVVPNGDA